MKSNYWKLPREEQEKLAESGAMAVKFFGHWSYDLNLEEFFTAHNIDPNAMATTKNSLGGWKQPLIHFAFNLGITDLKSKLKSAEYLLTQGANINAQDENCLTALDKVLGLGAQNPIKMVLFLLKNGAIPRDDYSPAQKHMYNTALKELPLAEQERLDLVNAAKLQAEQMVKLPIEQNELFDQGEHDAATDDHNVNLASAAQTIQEDDFQTLGDLAVIPQQ